MPTDTDLAYIAGLVDGEGYIGIKKSRAYKCQKRVTPGYHARISIRMVDEAAIRFLAETLGGWYYRENAHVAKGRPLFCYQATDLRAESILRALLPYLRVKREVAETVLRLRALQANGRKHRTKVVGHRTLPHWSGAEVRVRTLAFSDEYVAACDALYEQCKALNRTGV